MDAGVTGTTKVRATMKLDWSRMDWNGMEVLKLSDDFRAH